MIINYFQKLYIIIRINIIISDIKQIGVATYLYI